MYQIIIATTVNEVKPNIPKITNLTEYSILVCLAVYLIKGIWQEHIANERQERELTQKLLDHILADDQERET